MIICHSTDAHLSSKTSVCAYMQYVKEDYVTFERIYNTILLLVIWNSVYKK